MTLEEPIGFWVVGTACYVSPCSARHLEVLSGLEWRWTASSSARQPRHPIARRVDGKSVMLARVVVQATDNEEIGYRNGDPFDLRNENLMVTRQDRQMRRSLKLW